MGNRLMINMESRILGDGYVRFGGEYMGTWHFLKCQSTVCLAYGTEERCYYDDELYRVYKFDWEIQNGWLYLYYSDGYTFIIEYPSVSGRYFYGTAEDGFEIRLEWVDGRSIRKKVS